MTMLRRFSSSSGLRTLLPITRQLMEHRGLPVDEIHWPTSEQNPSFSLPFESSAAAKRQYEAPGSRVRLGRLLEDLDAFSADLAYAHCTEVSPLNDEQCEAPTIVTACVDRVALHGPAPLINDGNIEFQGKVTWTGRTSLEVRVTCTQGRRELAHSWFVMVARDAVSGQGVPVPPQLNSTAEELADGNHRQEIRQKRRDITLRKNPPSLEESALIHGLFSQGFEPPKVTMASTRAHSTLLMHVQERNIHGKVFGGYLCRVSFELAWIAALRLGKGELSVLRLIDDISFLRPVEVGSVLSFDAQVSYTDPARGLMVVDVRASVQQDYDSGSQQGVVTNVFHYIFAAPPHVTLPTIKFETYQEAMNFVAGRRRVLSSDFDSRI